MLYKRVECKKFCRATSFFTQVNVNQIQTYKVQVSCQSIQMPKFVLFTIISLSVAPSLSQFIIPGGENVSPTSSSMFLQYYEMELGCRLNCPKLLSPQLSVEN